MVGIILKWTSLKLCCVLKKKILRVNYCDGAVSVVLPVSCCVNFLPCVRSRGHTFSTIIMKLCQNVCLDKISVKLENGSCRVKAKSLGQILEKPCVHSGGHIFSPIIMKLAQNVCLNEISDKFENGSCLVKN